MFGFFAGALGAYAVFRLMRHRSGWGGGHRWGHAGGGYGRGRYGGWFLGGLSERLDATPGQEKVIREVAESLQHLAESFRGELEKARAAAARSIQAEAFDPTALRDAWTRHDSLISELRASVVDGLRKVHEALEPGQRRALGEILEGGWRSFAFGGGRCGGHAHGGPWQGHPQRQGYAA